MPAEENRARGQALKAGKDSDYIDIKFEGRDRGEERADQDSGTERVTGAQGREPAGAGTTND
jgi:hypothetical protein